MPKNIALFIDGTWNNAVVTAPTNVYKLYKATNAFSGPSTKSHGVPVANTGTKQVTHYIRGVGTGGWLDKRIGGLTGFGTPQKIREAYLFIAMNYQRGDRVYLFGFSRGAFAVRSLAMFVAVVGWTLVKHPNKINDAYVRFVQNEGSARIDRALLEDLQKEKSQLTTQELQEQRPIYVRFIGVWDTVKQTASPDSPTLPKHISTARHALALHDLRPEFEPTLWEDASSRQSLKQVWFPGAHSDVGGGYKDTVLSNTALLWMARESRRYGLLMDTSMLPSSTSPLGAIHEEKRKFDSLKPRNILSTCLYAKQRILQSFFIHKTTCAQILNAPRGSYWHDVRDWKERLRGKPERYELVSRAQPNKYTKHLAEVDDLTIELYRWLKSNNRKDPIQ